MWSSSKADHAPSTVNGSSGASCNPCYYTGSSEADGTYSLAVRSSTNSYKLYGWYSTMVNGAANYTRSGPYTVDVTVGGTTVTQDVSW